MVICGSLQQLLEKERSPRFAAAIVQLLEAYHSDLEAAQLEWRAEEAVASGELLDGHKKARTRPVARKEGSDRCKSADAPVTAQVSLGLDSAVTAAPDNQSGDCRPPSLEPNVYGSAQQGVVTRRGSVSSLGSQEFHRQHLKELLSQQEPSDPGLLQSVVASVYFEVASAATLLLFCLLTALDMQREGLALGYELGWPNYRAPEDSGWSQAGNAFSILMYVCVALFALELVVRLMALRCAFFSDVMNYFDMFILLSWAVEAAGSRLLGRLGILRMMRLLRLVRFVKLFRFITWLEALYFLIKAMGSSLKILLWCCLMLFAIQTVTAFLISQLLFAFYFPDTGHPVEERMMVFKYFGSFSRSLLTTFEMALGNWLVPARVLFEHVSEWSMILFLVHKVTVGFSVIGIINSVFVQETLQVATSDDHTMVVRKKKQANLLKSKLERLFRAADVSEDGRVTRDEFKELVEHPDVQTWLASLEYDCKDPDHLFDLLDKTQSGDLSSEEFFAGMTTLRGQARAMDLLHICKELEELRRISTELQYACMCKGDALASGRNAL